MKMYSDFDTILNDTGEHQIQDTEVSNEHCSHTGLNEVPA